VTLGPCPARLLRPLLRPRQRAMPKMDAVDPEKLPQRGEGVESYYGMLETSEFEDMVIDSGMAVTLLNLFFFVTFQFLSSDLALPLATSFVFLPMHVINHMFHHKKSLAKREYRQYFFLTMMVVGSMQSLFYAVRVGTDSGFLMLLLASLVYPGNAVAYMTEEVLMLVGALGLFAGGTLTVYTFVNGTEGVATPLGPNVKLLLQAVNYFVALGTMLLVTSRHMAKYEREKRLEEAIAFNAREGSGRRR